MVLAGQGPEVIMEVASRALAFWSSYDFSKQKQSITNLDSSAELVLNNSIQNSNSYKQNMSIINDYRIPFENKSQGILMA
ncbi:hypothetical protein AYI70_g5826 [Smittium culicis]|uniref:Uncharacterized protein n=1 Tax=Smittium culicis TaxID=133412 RepID=A0A1R1XSR5_9FUNG|nr:hypothetical protein AYI70_g5976 [Smittium culicis]OMJ17671.1 hypothetical protein AYI70_g5826 [Smittium culicis]